MPQQGSRRHVLIVGGGITGLASAYTLERETDFDITLLEASHRLGGVIQTVCRDDLVVELGPDSLFTGKPEALELIHELGLERELIEPSARGFSVLIEDRLYPVPLGLVGLSGIDPSAVRSAEFLTEEAKERALREEPIDPELEDLSIADFFTRRYGQEFSEKVAEPILAGTHAGDPKKLSTRALFPRFWKKEPTPRSAGPAFVSLRGGMQTLVDRLEASLTRTRISLCDRLLRLEPADKSMAARKEEDPQQLNVDHVLLAFPANRAARFLTHLEPEAASLARQIEFASSTIVTVALESDLIQEQLHGTGFLVPPRSDSLLKGCTLTSQKWPGRAPQNLALLRFFFAAGCTDGELREELTQALALLSIHSQPRDVLINHWDNAFPQYGLGHLERADRIEAQLKPYPISVAGSSYRGVGIPDCIRQGREAAREIARRLN